VGEINKKENAMRYWLLNIEIRTGEYEFHSIGAHTSKGKIDTEAYLKDFYSDSEKNGDWYETDAGCIAYRLYDIQELTKKEYDVMRKYI
jgi:hypothetical protein